VLYLRGEGEPTMQPVKSPAREGDYADRFLDCQEGLESKMQQLMEEALRAGWSREEIGTAFVEIGDRLMLAAVEIRKTMM